MLNGAQFHLIFNHLPIVGFALYIPIMIMASLSRRSDYKRLALTGAMILGLLVLPAFWSGEPAEHVVEGFSGVSEAQIEDHEESADFALAAALLTSGIAALGWFLTRKSETRLPLATKATALAVIVTSGLMAWVGHEGGKIRHPEIGDPSGWPSTQGQPLSEARHEKDEPNDDD